MTTSGLNWSTQARHCANRAPGSPFSHGFPGGSVNHSTCTSWSIDTEHPGLPSFTATTPYCDMTRPSPTPSVPATESPTMRTFTGSVYVVVGDRPGPVVPEDRAAVDERAAGEVAPAPAANVPDVAPASAAPSTLTDALATSLTPTVARNVVSTARLAAMGMA